jgi:hypothetical protein
MTPDSRSPSPSALYDLVHRAICNADRDDADRAALSLYLHLLDQMKPTLPGREEHAPSLVATLMLAMARHHLARAAGRAPSHPHAR